MKNDRFDVISPDGFSIHIEDTYATISEAVQAFNEWSKRYVQQGYYSSMQYGKIALYELADYCKIVNLNNGQSICVR